MKTNNRLRWTTTANDVPLSPFQQRHFRKKHNSWGSLLNSKRSSCVEAQREACGQWKWSLIQQLLHWFALILWTTSSGSRPRYAAQWWWVTQSGYNLCADGLPTLLLARSPLRAKNSGSDYLLQAESTYNCIPGTKNVPLQSEQNKVKAPWFVIFNKYH
jgi:hypothetical protein